MDRKIPTIKKDQKVSEGSWLRGGSGFARSAYGALFDRRESGKQDAWQEIIELN